jgi:hypothetical protein
LPDQGSSGMENNMQIISAETVEQIYIKMWNMSEQDAFRLSYTLEKEQPVLVAYLATVDKEIFNQAEREVLFYLGTVVWQIMSDGKSPLPAVSEDCLLRHEESNNFIARTLETAQTVNFAEVVKNILKVCHQTEVLRYIIATLMDEDSSDNDIRDENLGFMILDLKTVIECFDEEQKG